MHFTLMFFESTEGFAARQNPEKQREYLAGWSHYVHALRDSGVAVTGFGLHAPETAATMKRSDGTVFVQDGPFTETKEQLGGVFVIDVPDLDAALEWAARAPVDAVEVRQNLPAL
ncbi:YciI family protein [Paenibacillus sacheonensis]|uniref:YciI family protein n=1 Tax=Paenibacillus sacheonensis TaxID=742054 RepID=A0A7X4YRW7_9BACL|nr:YciI family protein [Paenibacillus sacheonensis]MBM7567497.1 hypothetical protein [Paenibacillus sacheonensis]NBC71398.1 YciI family protein [Paenibacillus sacheonensis]